MKAHRRRRRATKSASCNGKDRHPSKGAALAAIKSLIAAHKTVEGAMEPYRCKFCRSWHTGHARKNR